MKVRFVAGGWAAAALFLVGTGRPAQAQALRGAGSSFVAPAMERWAQAYQKQTPGVTIRYESIGSGEGIRVYRAGQVDFGATDAPLTSAEGGRLSRPTLQIPVIAGAVALSYNLPGVGTGLRLSPEVIAGIFQGGITSWNDPRIARENPGRALPPLAITVCRRSDSSGTTYIFTDYLSSATRVWRLGRGKVIAWRTGVPGKGNGGVADAIQSTPGAIGYVEPSYAEKRKLPSAAVKNRAGNYVLPSLPATIAAVNGAAVGRGANGPLSLARSADGSAYPICGFVYILAPRVSGTSPATAQFLRWILGPGQEIARTLNYAPLPKAVAAAYLRRLSALEAAGR